ncbi:MAG: SRPBCC family protein [Chloroflexota bacterium]
MTTIDQRILIPAPPEVVWELISDIGNNPRWQAGCTSVTYLTSKRAGPGVRWRQTMDKGDEYVIEITAWYDGLGYQYTYVDGLPFRESTGRIRLQEIPEGTVVQWTITYEAAGLFGQMRAALGLKRRLDNMLVLSLKTLWKQVNESGSAKKYREAKSLIREAPDAEARANYRPRHTPVIDLRVEAGQSDHGSLMPVTAPVIDEPPLSDEDTRPRRPVSPPPAMPVQPRQTIDELVAETEEPEFLREIDARTSSTVTDDERFKPPQPAASSVAAPEQQVEASGKDTQRTPESELRAVEVADRDSARDQSASEHPVVTTGQPESVTDEPSVSEARAIETPRDTGDAIGAPSAPPAESAGEQPSEAEGEQTGAFRPVTDLSSMDTARLSIWEIFGVPRPSELDAAPVPQPGEATPVADPGTAIEEATPAEQVAATTPESGKIAVEMEPPAQAGEPATPLPARRSGLRQRLRRKSARLRYPA